jgi:leucyl-tRNA synthetase
MKKYDFRAIEEKWQRRWEDEDTFKVELQPEQPKYYLLEMFPYPSGRIHMGHVRNYSIGDVMARYRHMRGYNVLHPMGWDAFGLPAENAAIQHGVHPAEWTLSNIANMRKQLKSLGYSYAWHREVTTCLPDYYKWTQWFFTKLWEKDLVYRASGQVNWCEACATVLANEQVANGECWRCGTPVIQKELEQWYLKITAYAEELLNDLDTLEGWPERVRIMQSNWIGRSEGARIDFRLPNDKILPVFTTRPDTVYGVTYLALAAENPLAKELSSGTPQEEEVRAFIERMQHRTTAQRGDTAEKEGVFTGAYAINPLNGTKVPIWVANYVLMEYGTGAVMAVPAHDQRDFEFAQQYGLAVRRVIAGPDTSRDEMAQAYVDDGVMMNSGHFNGRNNREAMSDIIDYIAVQGFGERNVNYRLRDWLISRQRYWGAPIPMVYCEKCGWKAVPEESLPVILPENVAFSPEGQSPLTEAREFIDVDCPVCSGPAYRETDTMDPFIDSSWYFLRYADPHNDRTPFSRDCADHWLPVDQYIGGIEHAVMHLLYARFFTKVIRDIGLTSVSEPFANLLTQGMVIKDGSKMSKSKGNVVDPNEIIERYGADTARLFILFASPPERDLEWSDRGVEGSFRFLSRIWRLVNSALPVLNGCQGTDVSNDAADLGKLRRYIHSTIKRVSEDIEIRLHFNTAISAIMELVNMMADKLPHLESGRASADYAAEYRNGLETIVMLLVPFTPHISEELWQKLGHETMAYLQPWPTWREEYLHREEITIVVQINGKVRDRLTVESGISEEGLKEAALSSERTAKFLSGLTVRKVVVVPGRLVNIVAS